MKSDSVETYLALGNALAKSGRLDDAIAAYKTVLQLKPGDANARSNLGVVLLQRANALVRDGHTSEAIAEYKAALPFKPDSEELHYNLGVALSQLVLTSEAMGEFETVLRLAPRSAQAHNTLVCFCSQPAVSARQSSISKPLLLRIQMTLRRNITSAWPFRNRVEVVRHSNISKLLSEFIRNRRRNKSILSCGPRTEDMQGRFSWPPPSPRMLSHGGLLLLLS